MLSSVPIAWKGSDGGGSFFRTGIQTKNVFYLIGCGHKRKEATAKSEQGWRKTWIHFYSVVGFHSNFFWLKLQTVYFLNRRSVNCHLNLHFNPVQPNIIGSCQLPMEHPPHSPHHIHLSSIVCCFISSATHCHFSWPHIWFNRWKIRDFFSHLFTCIHDC